MHLFLSVCPSDKTKTTETKIAKLFMIPHPPMNIWLEVKVVM